MWNLLSKFLLEVSFFLRSRYKAVETDWQRKSQRRINFFSLNFFLLSSPPPCHINSGILSQAKAIKGFCFIMKHSVYFDGKHDSIIQSHIPPLVSLRVSFTLGRAQLIWLICGSASVRILRDGTAGTRLQIVSRTVYNNRKGPGVHA